MKTILVDAVKTFVINSNGPFKINRKMQILLDSFQNRKIILTGINDEQNEKFGLNDMLYEVFTLKHDPEKTDSKYFD